MKRNGEANSGRWNGSGGASFGGGGGGIEEEVDAAPASLDCSLDSPASDPASVGTAAGIAAELDSFAAAVTPSCGRGGCNVVTALGSTEMRSPGFNRVFGSVTWTARRRD